MNCVKSKAFVHYPLVFGHQCTYIRRVRQTFEKNSSFQKRIYTRGGDFFVYFNNLYKWLHTDWMTSFLGTYSNSKNSISMLSKLISGNDQMSVGKFRHCLYNDRNMSVWMTIEVPFIYATYVHWSHQIVFASQNFSRVLNEDGNFLHVFVRTSAKNIHLHCSFCGLFSWSG